MRIAGAVIVFITGIITGIYFSNYFKNKSKYIETLIDLFSEIRLNISFSNIRMVDILSSLKAKYPMFISERITQSLDDEKTFISEWKNTFCSEKYLTDYENELLISFGGYLGKYDKDNQINIIDGIITKLQKQYDCAVNNCTTKSRLYRNLCILLGIAAGIMII